MSYVKHGHRVSLLPITQYCGAAGRLSEAHGAGRPAAMSSAFHARQAGAPDAATKWALLSDDEQREVASWKAPGLVDIPGGPMLEYASAHKEVPLGIDDLGFYVDPSSGEDCLTIGHMDFGWAFDDPIFGLTAYVADIKKSLWTSAEGPDSLQLHGYGWAFARKMGCDSYCTGLWIAEEGEWLWSKEIVELDSDRGQQIWERISAAASNNGEFNTGAHCRGCYARLHCPEHVLPAATVDTWLAPGSIADGMSPTSEEALDFLLKVQATEDLCKKARENLEMLVAHGKLRIEQNGKAWLPVNMPGRESLDKEGLARELGPRLGDFVRRGKPYTQMRWLKV